MSVVFLVFLYFFVKDAAPTEIYTYGHTLSLHDALPIWSPPFGLLGLLGGSGLCGLVALDVDDGLVEPLARQRPEFGRADVHHLRDQGPVLVEEVPDRSEEHTSELQSLMRISYAVFCLKKKKHTTTQHHLTTHNG